MGCILSLFEFVLEEIVFGYFLAMQWIIPKRFFGKILRFILQAFVGIYSFALCVIMFLSVIGLIFGDTDTKEFAVYTFFIPLGLSLCQIFLGYLVKKYT